MNNKEMTISTNGLQLWIEHGLWDYRWITKI